MNARIANQCNTKQYAVECLCMFSMRLLFINLLSFIYFILFIKRRDPPFCSSFKFLLESLPDATRCYDATLLLQASIAVQMLFSYTTIIQLQNSHIMK